MGLRARNGTPQWQPTAPKICRIHFSTMFERPNPLTIFLVMELSAGIVTWFDNSVCCCGGMSFQLVYKHAIRPSCPDNRSNCSKVAKNRRPPGKRSDWTLTQLMHTRPVRARRRLRHRTGHRARPTFAQSRDRRHWGTRPAGSTLARGQTWRGAGLARAIDLNVIRSAVVPIGELRPSTFIGKGKVEEIAALVKTDVAGIVVMDCASRRSSNATSKRLGTPSARPNRIDPRNLGRRAHTREGSLQVELLISPIKRAAWCAPGPILNVSVAVRLPGRPG